jgi:hypothetical protein
MALACVLLTASEFPHHPVSSSLLVDMDSMGASLGLNHGSIIYEKKNRKKILVTLQTVLLRNTVFWFLWRLPI